LPQIATFRLPFQQFACTCDIRIRHIFDAMHVPQRVLDQQDIPAFEMFASHISKFPQQPIGWRQVHEFSPNTVNDAALLLEMQWTICVKFEVNETRPLGSR
jgi:hypothetical protein